MTKCNADLQLYHSWPLDACTGVGWRWKSTGDVGASGGIGGYIWKMQMVYCKLLLKTKDGLLQIIEHELRPMGPTLVPLLATRCLYLGSILGWWGGGTSYHTPAWPTDWPNVMLTCSSTTIDDYMPVHGVQVGVGESGGKRGCRGVRGHWQLHMKNEVLCKLLLKTQDGLLQTIEHELRSSGPNLVLVLATRCLYWGYVWLKFSLTQRLTKCQAHLM